MSSKGTGILRSLAAVIIVALFLLGCGAREVSISPLPSGNEGSSNLGVGSRPLTFGPGYKGSPQWSSDGSRISYTIDGYVVDKGPTERDSRRWTARDFGAREIESHFGNSMILLARDPEEPDAPGSLYEATPGGNTPNVEEVAQDVLAAEPFGEGEAVIAALRLEDDESVLVLVRSGEVDRVFAEIEGEVSGFSVSPNQRRVAASIIPPGEERASEIRVLDLQNGDDAQTATLDDGREVFGPPQWTTNGVYFVAGAEQEDDTSTSLYGLYRLASNSENPEPAPGVGDDFTASSVKRSPDGSRLAIIGRVHPNSSVNLYILDLESQTLKAATSSEDMEIKNSSRDISWSPDGESVVVVARGSFSSPRIAPAAAEDLLDEFYNLYEVPVDDLEDESL